MNAPQPVTTTTDIRLMNATASLLFGLVLLGALISAASSTATLAAASFAAASASS